MVGERACQDDGAGDVNESSDAWVTSFTTSYKCLEERHKDNDSVNSPGGAWPHELSLVATYAKPSDPEGAEPGISSSGPGHKVPKLAPCSNYNVNGNPVVLVVAWMEPQPTVMSGRVCDIKDGKILALVPARHSLMNFQSCEVILNTLHMRPHKMGPKDRPIVPENAMRLLHMWEAAISRIHAAPNECISLDDCIWCHRRDKTDQDESDTSDMNPIFTCSMCLLPCHRACSVENTSAIDMSKRLPKVDPAVIPKRFTQPGVHGHNALCALCEQYLCKP